MYETQTRLDRLREIAKKPDLVTKINKIVGIDFAGYCHKILGVSIDRNLMDKI